MPHRAIYLLLLLTVLIFFRGQASAKKVKKPRPTAHTSVHTSNYTASSEYLAQRVPKYCNRPPATLTDENKPPLSGATLLQVQVAFRHGDRSAIHVIPKSQRIKWPCTEPSHEEVQWAASILQPFLSSPDCVTFGSAECVKNHAAQHSQHALPNRVDHALRAWRTARALGEPCGADGGKSCPRVHILAQHF
jgi:hypothetical protein